MDRRKYQLEGRVCKDCVNTLRTVINTMTPQLPHLGFYNAIYILLHTYIITVQKEGW